MSLTLTDSDSPKQSNAVQKPETTAGSTEQAGVKVKSLPISAAQILALLGTVVFIVSHFFLWWELQLVAPQFPGGLFIQATSYEIQDSPKTSFNDIREVDGLNHYIGMMSLGDAAQFEMSIAIPAIIIFALLGVAAVVLRKKWAPLLTIPIILYPIVYLADLAYWLWYAGHNLDSTAAITLEAFTPRLLGTGTIAQFSTVAELRPGWYVAAAAALLCLTAIVLAFRRKPAS